MLENILDIIVYANAACNDAAFFSVFWDVGVGWGEVGGAIAFSIDVFIDFHTKFTLRFMICKIFSCT